ncbi:MAG TPA: TetR/AcrR family transcriptional regulator [Kofleriaceae bacterium]|nr:TetR/AcrR family transcriptional regulator [Kofleriaceae bacterium]
MTETATKGERTRAKLTATAAALMQRQGYHATGLSQIVDESGAPRGSLYFHFPGGKEELAVAALRDVGVVWKTRIETAIEGAPDLGAAIVSVCRMFADQLAASDWQLGCPLATVALEASSSSEAVRTVCVEHFRGWEAAIAARLAASGADPEAALRMAMFALATIEGALMLARVERSARPLEIAGEGLRNLVALVAMGVRHGG